MPNLTRSYFIYYLLRIYRLSDEVKDRASRNLDSIFTIVSQQINTFRIPEVLIIYSRTLKNLNAYIENGVIKDGLGISGIKDMFERFLGDLNSLDYSDENNILYRINFNGVRNFGDEYKINSLVVRKQTMEDWYRAVLEMFKQYTPVGNDRVDKLMAKSGISPTTVFTASFDSNPADNDVKLAKVLQELVINIFGRYTYISMITGSLFVKDSILNFISQPYQTFVTAARKNGITLLHKDIPMTSLNKLDSAGTIYRAYSILLDLMTLGPQVRLRTGPDVKLDFELLNAPHMPMELWMPMFLEASELGDSSKMVDFYNTISSLAGAKLITEFPNVEVSLGYRAPGNMKLFKALSDLYAKLIEDDKSLTAEQKSMYKTMALEQINFFVFASTASNDVTKRIKLRNFFESKGLVEYPDFEIKFPAGYPDHLKKLDLDRTFYDFVGEKFGLDSINEIIESLDPARVHPGTLDRTHRTAYTGEIEYYTANILRAQKDQIVKFGNFLKNLADNVEGNNRIAIQPFTSYSTGFAYSERAAYLTYFPNPTLARADQTFVMEGNFKDSFIKILGGLLVDHQTFVISEIDSAGNVVRYLCAFNLLSGALALRTTNPNRLDLYVPRPITNQYKSAPIVASFDSSLYDITDPNSIINVMNDFYENNNAIGYQRISPRADEFLVWSKVCGSLMFIKDFF